MALIPRAPAERIPHFVNAVCTAIDDIGYHNSSYGGVDYRRRQLKFTFETDKMDADGEVLEVSRVFNWRMQRCASLRKAIHSWLGHRLSQDEVRDFDLWCLLNAHCRIKLVPASDTRYRKWDIEKIKPPLKKRGRTTTPATTTSK